jgi:hypothetical protein
MYSYDLYQVENSARSNIFSDPEHLLQSALLKIWGAVTDSSMPAAETSGQPPQIEPALRAIAMPADANPRGDIFGGWLLNGYRRRHGKTCTRGIAGWVAVHFFALRRFFRSAITLNAAYNSEHFRFGPRTSGCFKPMVNNPDLLKGTDRPRSGRRGDKL